MSELEVLAKAQLEILIKAELENEVHCCNMQWDIVMEHKMAMVLTQQLEREIHHCNMYWDRNMEQQTSMVDYPEQFDEKKENEIDKARQNIINITLLAIKEKEEIEQTNQLNNIKANINIGKDRQAKQKLLVEEPKITKLFLDTVVKEQDILGMNKCFCDI